MKHYTGRDLGQDFRTFFTNEKRRLTKYLKELDCTNIQMSRQFYYFYGFFTSKSGQKYYFSCSDIRHFGYTKILYRTVNSYTDYTGGMNQYVNVDADSLRNIKLI